jgi:hypothetical protein
VVVIKVDVSPSRSIVFLATGTRTRLRGYCEGSTAFVESTSIENWAETDRIWAYAKR